MKVKLIDKETRKILIESDEELWHLTKLIAGGDVVSGASYRKFKVQEGEKGEKKRIFVHVRTEKVEFATGKVRVTGTIVEGTPEEFVQRGSYHTLDIEKGFDFGLKKKEWGRMEEELLKRMREEGKQPIVKIIAMDEKKATFATLYPFGLKQDFEMHNRAGKGDERCSAEDRKFIEGIFEKIKEMKEETIVVAGPGFEKEKLKKMLEEERIQKKVVFESCSTAEIPGIYELLNSGKISQIIGETRIEKEIGLMEEFLKRIAREGRAVYGKDDVFEAINSGKVEILLILDELLRAKEYDTAAGTCEKMKGKVVIFSSESDTGGKLKSFGGIAALLRF